MGNSTIGGEVPGGQNQIIRRLNDIERRVRELASSRSLGSSSVDAGGIQVNPTGTGMDLQVLNGEAQISFHAADTTQNRAIVHCYDGGPGQAPWLVAECAREATGLRDHAYLSLAPRVAQLVAENDNGQANLQVSLGANSYDGNANMAFGNQQWWTGPSWNSAGLSLRSTGSEWRAQVGSNLGAGYVPLRASSFPTSSSKGQKQNITDLPFDALDAIRSAPAFRWQYKPSQAADDRFHISPMADDLPDELVEGRGADMNVDTRDLTGVLWSAVGDLKQQLDAALARIAELEQNAAAA